MASEEAIKVIEVIEKRYITLDATERQALILVIQALEQESKTGWWFIDERPESDREVVCSNCDRPIFKYHKLDFDYRPKYCPNCGARMREVEE